MTEVLRADAPGDRRPVHRDRPNDRNNRPGAPPSRIDGETFRIIEAANRKVYNSITIPQMSTGATDMAYLRAKGVQCYGIGPMTDEEDGPKGFGAHSDQESIPEEGLYKFVQFNWEVATALAGSANASPNCCSVKESKQYGAFQVELMLSLEPATIADRRYPLLFQTGETAYGVHWSTRSIPTISSWLWVPLHAPVRGGRHARSLLRAGRRPRARARSLSPSRLGHGTARGADFPPFAGFHPHCRRCGDGRDPLQEDKA